MIARRKIMFKRLLIFSLMLISLYGILFFKDSSKSIEFNYDFESIDNKKSCSIPKLNVEAPEIMKYIKKIKPLSCPKYQDDWLITEKGFIKIEPKILSLYEDINCKLNYIIRDGDFNYKISDTFELNSKNRKVELKHDFLEATCESKSNSLNFDKIFASVKYDSELVKKQKNINKNKLNLNVMIYGYDSLARIHFMRQLPKTYDYLTSKLDAKVLKMYNIVGDGSPQAIIPILTGSSEPELPSTLKNQKNSNYVDVYPFVWNNFTENGYITQYGEDTPHIGTFTYRMKGFNKQPTNLYSRPYYLRAWKKHFTSKNLCYNGKPRHQIMMNWTKEFFDTYSNEPKFVFNFYTEISHDDFNLVQIADDDIVNWLDDLNKMNIFNNTIMMFFSDHGCRFSNIRESIQGKLEERLPFVSFVLPKWFPEKFPNAYNNLLINSERRLLTPFDIYSTLLTVIEKFNKGLDVDNHKTYDSKLPRSLSIFENIPESRNCKDADIDNHWCTCLKWLDLDTNNETVVKSSEYLVKFINELNSKYTSNLCSNLTVKKITRAQKIEPEKDLIHFKKSADANGFVPDLSDKVKIENELYQIQVITSPSDGLYEATIHYNNVKKKFSMKETEISRINMYGDQDHCIHDTEPQLRKYCHCINPKVKRIV